MRTTTVHCNRCGSTIQGGHSVLELKAGDLAKRHDEPWIDLCGACSELFSSWLRSGRQDVQTVREMIPAAAVVDSAGRVA
jgi:hypothetical protein